MKPYSERAKYQKIYNHKTIHIFCTKLQIPWITNFTLNLPLTLTWILESSYKKHKTQTLKINPQAYCKKFSTWKQIPLIKATYLKKTFTGVLATEMLQHILFIHFNNTCIRNMKPSLYNFYFHCKNKTLFYHWKLMFQLNPPQSILWCDTPDGSQKAKAHSTMY